MDSLIAGPPVHQPLTARELGNPSGMMWMILALVALHEDAPPNGDTQDSIQQATEYRNAVEEVMRVFSPLHRNFMTTITQAERIERYQAAFRLTGARMAYHLAANTPPDIECQSRFFISIFMRFYQQIILYPVQGPLHPYSIHSMETAIARVMRSLVHDIVSLAVDNFYHTTAGAQISRLKDSFRDLVGRILEDYVRRKMERPDVGGVVPQDSIADHVILLIQPSLYEYIGEVVSDLYADIGFGTMNVLIQNSPAMEACVDEFYNRLGQFFSFRSSLLSDFWSENEDEDDIPAHVANHNFAQYTDDDWFERERELFDGQDVLRGPENVTLDDVTIPVEAAEDDDLFCGVCRDSDATFRELKVCGHVFCDSCLRTQLQAQHECRYKCSLCRAEFFSEEIA